jgi:hypothetical protein
MKIYAFGLLAALFIWPLALSAQESDSVQGGTEQNTLSTPQVLDTPVPHTPEAEASIDPYHDTLGQVSAQDPYQTDPAYSDIPPDFSASFASDQRTYLGALYVTPDHGLQGVQVLSVIPGSPAARAGFIGANTSQKKSNNWLKVAIFALSMSPAGAFAIPLTIAHQVYTNRKALAPVDLPGDLIVAVDDKPIQDAQTFSQTLGSYEPGDRVSFSIIRAGKPLQIAVTLEREPL